MDGFALVVRFELRPGHEEAFDTLVVRTVPLVAAREEGTLAYRTHHVPGHPGSRVFYELYRDRPAFDEHEQQPHVRAFLAQRAEHVESVDVVVLTPDA